MIDDYATLDDAELDDLAKAGDERAELESRRRHLTPLRTHVTICADCGATINRDTDYRRDDDGQEWRDPFAAFATLHLVHDHPRVCTALGRRLRRRSGARTYTVTVDHPETEESELERTYRDALTEIAKAGARFDARGTHSQRVVDIARKALGYRT